MTVPSTTTIGKVLEKKCHFMQKGTSLSCTYYSMATNECEQSSICLKLKGAALRPFIGSNIVEHVFIALKYTEILVH